MKREIKEHLVVLMNEIGQNIEKTKAIARAACTESESRRYEMRADEVLEHVANARAHVLAATVDADG